MDFKDINFKISVVSILHDMGYYTEEVEAIIEKSEWDEAYVPIPEVMEFYKNLVIDPKYLAKIEELMPDGGDIAYQYIFTEWDGEDDQMDITSIEGIENLTKLQRFEPISMITPDGIDFSPILKCKKLEAVDMSSWAKDNDTNKAVMAELEKRGVEVS